MGAPDAEAQAIQNDVQNPWPLACSKVNSWKAIHRGVMDGSKQQLSFKRLKRVAKDDRQQPREVASG